MNILDLQFIFSTFHYLNIFATDNQVQIPAFPQILPTVSCWYTTGLPSITEWKLIYVFR